MFYSEPFWLCSLTCVVEPFDDVVSHLTMQIVAFFYFHQCNAFVMCFSFILTSICNLCARAQRRSISMHPMPCRFVQKRRCKDANKRINKKWRCNRFLCQTTTIFGIMLCIQMSWSTKQFGDTMALHLSYRESIFQSPYRLISKLNTSMWHITRKRRNRLMHGLNGNGGSKSKGKGVGENSLANLMPAMSNNLLKLLPLFRPTSTVRT